MKEREPTMTTTEPQLSPAIIDFVDDLVEGIRILAAALVGKASHPDAAATDLDVDS